MKYKAVFLLFFTILTMAGCALPKNKTYPPSEAEKKLIAFCLKEGNLPIIVRRVDNTLWIYAPLKFAIFDMKAGSENAEKPERKVQPLALLSLQAEFARRYFKFSYDVVPDVLPNESVSYGSTYTEEYAKKRQLIYQAIQKSILSAEETPADKLPEFIVILAADITRGIATRSIIYLQDLQASLTEAIPSEEYYMRELNEVIGRDSLINDTTGRGVPFARISWPYFLTEQIKNRIKYKFTSSDFPPEEDPQGTIAAIAANTLKLYPFTNYDGVILYARRPSPIRDEKGFISREVKEVRELKLDKEKLKSYAEKQKWEDKGKTTTIRFELPNPNTSTAETKEPAAQNKK